MNKKRVIPCELALIAALVINSICVSLIVKSNFGISTMSSVPLALSKIFDFLTFGTWNSTIQSLCILILIAVTRHFKIGYLLSFVLAAIFGVLLDIDKALMLSWPVTMPWRVFYFTTGFLCMNFGASLFQRCKLPALPFDIFIRDLTSYFKTSVRRVKTTVDIIFVSTTLTLSLSMLGYVYSVGIGTVIAAFLTGTITNFVCNHLDKLYSFEIKSAALSKIFK